MLMNNLECSGNGEEMASRQILKDRHALARWRELGKLVQAAAKTTTTCLSSVAEGIKLKGAVQSTWRTALQVLCLPSNLMGIIW